MFDRNLPGASLDNAKTRADIHLLFRDRDELIPTQLTDFVIGLLIAAGVLAVLALVQALLTWRERRRIQPPGSMTNGLHVVKLGQGVPSVVFESGIANSCLSWNLIQPQIANLAATYSYDRAGLGWSLPQHDGCSLDVMTADLHALLDSLRVHRPLVLVGHSFGCYIVRLFAYRFPNEVAGLMLIDPITPEEWMNPTRQQRWRLRRAIFFTRVTGALACFGVVRFGLWLLLLRKKETPGPISRFSQTLQRIRSELSKIRPEVLPLIRTHWSRPGFFWTMAAYLQALPDCAKAVSSRPIPANLPVTVLSGAHQPPERLAEHEAVATRHVIAEQSAHFIYLDEPDLVVRELRRAIEAAQ
jgi:pimeloyl-ACP methyl ester carboxylesterase